MTYNLFFKNRRPDLSIRFIKKQDPDILAVQELTPAWKGFLSDAFAKKYPYHYTKASSGTNGIGLYSKYPIKENQFTYNRQHRLLAQFAKISIAGRELLLANVHLSSPAIAVENPDRFFSLYGDNYASRKEEFLMINQWLGHQKTPSKLLLGDFNTMTIEPLFRGIRSEWNNLYQEVGEGFGFNFPNSYPWNQPLLTLDYILYQGNIKPIEAKVIKKGKSDHFAIIGTLSL